MPEMVMKSDAYHWMFLVRFLDNAQCSPHVCGLESVPMIYALWVYWACSALDFILNLMEN
jgi:hypothetical protein